MDPFVELGAEIRRLIRQEAREVAQPPERFEVVTVDPLAVVSIKDGDFMLEQGDEDFALSQSVKDLQSGAGAMVPGDHVLVVRDDDDDYLALAALRRGQGG